MNVCEKGLFKYWDFKVSRQEMRSEISSVIDSTISALLHLPYSFWDEGKKRWQIINCTI